jgi:hypothetical protein
VDQSRTAEIIDIDMARQHLARRSEPLLIAAEIARLRDAAERRDALVWSLRLCCIRARQGHKTPSGRSEANDRWLR